MKLWLDLFAANCLLLMLCVKNACTAFKQKLSQRYFLYELFMLLRTYETRVEIKPKEKGTVKIKSGMRDIHLAKGAIFTERLSESGMPSCRKVQMNESYLQNEILR